jgi:hypothetical protein
MSPLNLSNSEQCDVPAKGGAQEVPGDKRAQDFVEYALLVFVVWAASDFSKLGTRVNAVAKLGQGCAGSPSWSLFFLTVVKISDRHCLTP